MVINILEARENTHGWHLDDPLYALVIIAEHPSYKYGGNLQYIRNWELVCKETGLDPITDLHQAIAFARGRKLIHSVSHVAGECYFDSCWKTPA